MIEARPRPGITLEPGEAPPGLTEPAQNSNADHARRRLGALDNAVRFPTEGFQPNRLDLPGNRWTLRTLTRSQPSPATSQKRQEGWVPRKQLPSRPTQSDGKPARCRLRR